MSKAEAIAQSLTKLEGTAEKFVALYDELKVNFVRVKKQRDELLMASKELIECLHERRAQNPPFPWHCVEALEAAIATAEERVP